MEARWNFTAWTVTSRRRATSLFVRPCAISSRTSVSRRVRLREAVRLTAHDARSASDDVLRDVGAAFAARPTPAARVAEVNRNARLAAQFADDGRRRTCPMG